MKLLPRRNPGQPEGKDLVFPGIPLANERKIHDRAIRTQVPGSKGELIKHKKGGMARWQFLPFPVPASMIHQMQPLS